MSWSYTTVPDFVTPVGLTGPSFPHLSHLSSTIHSTEFPRSIEARMPRDKACSGPGPNVFRMNSRTSPTLITGLTSLQAHAIRDGVQETNPPSNFSWTLTECPQRQTLLSLSVRPASLIFSSADLNSSLEKSQNARGSFSFSIP